MKKILPVLLIVVLLTGCGQAPQTVRDFILNTEVYVTVYRSRDVSAAQDAMELCRQLELIFSRTQENSELARLNRREITEVSDHLARVIETGLEYGRITDGAFDITMGAVTSLWDFTAEAPVVPTSDAVDEALSSVSWNSISVKGNNITFRDPHTQLDLGGIAKGYIADRMAELLEDRNVSSAIISLGGNLYFLGGKPDGSDFQAGIQLPYASRSTTIGGLPVQDCSIVTSGVYERCFTLEDVFYHHILDPETGFPAETELTAVTIISASSLEADALSTASFLLGPQRGMELIESLDGVEAIFITEDLQPSLSSGLVGRFYST